MYDNEWFNPKEKHNIYKKSVYLSYDKLSRSFTVHGGRKGNGKLLLTRTVFDHSNKSFTEEKKVLEEIKKFTETNKYLVHICPSINPAGGGGLKGEIEFEENPNICVCYNPEKHTITVHSGKDTKGKLLLDFNLFNRTDYYLIEEKSKLKEIKEYAVKHGYKLFLTGSTSLLIQQIQKQDEEKKRNYAKKKSDLGSDSETERLATYLL